MCIYMSHHYLPRAPYKLYHLMDNSHFSTQISQANYSDYIQMMEDTSLVQFRKIMGQATLMMQSMEGSAFSSSVSLLQDLVEQSKPKMKEVRDLSSSSSEEERRILKRLQAYKPPAKRCKLCFSQLLLTVLVGCEHSCCHTCIATICEGQILSQRANCVNCYFNFKLLEHTSGIFKPPIPGLSKRRPRFPLIKIDLNLKQCSERLEALQTIIEACYHSGKSLFSRRN